MAVPPPSAERLAVALLRLTKIGDHQAKWYLLDGLDAEELRAVLLAQTNNASVLLAALFGERIRESRLPQVSKEFHRTPDEVTRDHLEYLALALAKAE